MSELKVWIVIHTFGESWNEWCIKGAFFEFDNAVELLDRLEADLTNRPLIDTYEITSVTVR